MASVILLPPPLETARLSVSSTSSREPLSETGRAHSVRSTRLRTWSAAQIGSTHCTEVLQQLRQDVVAVDGFADLKCSSADSGHVRYGGEIESRGWISGSLGRRLQLVFTHPRRALAL
jgi:hypothetical protein